MQKTPVMRPVVEAVTFGFERIGMIIRIAWLPVFMVLVLAAGFTVLAFDSLFTIDVTALESDDPEEVLRAFATEQNAVGIYKVVLLATAFAVLAQLIFTPVLVAITRASTLAEYEPPSLPFYFALGARELRHFAVQLLYGVLISTIAVTFGGLAFGMGAATFGMVTNFDGIMQGIAMGLGGLATVSIALVGIWLALRFITVLPIAAVENRISFGDAWAMTKGNFWRLLLSSWFFINIYQAATTALALAVMLPVLLLAFFIGSIFFSTGAVYLLMGIYALMLLPSSILLASYALGAEAAFPGRIYAYLSGCGDDCKIFCEIKPQEVA